MQSDIRCLVIGVFALTVSGCVSNTASTATQGNRSSNTSTDVAVSSDDGIPNLPSDYKNLAAIHLVHGFINDADGPPEISDVVRGKAPLGASSIAVIRFPVRREIAARRNVVAVFGGGPYYRCASISAHTGLSTLGSTTVTLQTEKIDIEKCSPTLKYNPYSELEALAARCRIPGGKCEYARRVNIEGTVISGM